MTMLLAAALLMTPAPCDTLAIGSAAHYAPSYDHGGWDAIIARHRQWGQIADDFPYSPEGYWCVQPDHELGDRLLVVNAETGDAIVCTVADAVAPRDEAHWRASVVVEMSWAAFVAAGGRAHNRFVVTEVPA